MWPFNSKPKKEVHPLPIEKQKVLEQKFREAIERATTKLQLPPLPKIEAYEAYIEYWMNELPEILENRIKAKANHTFLFYKKRGSDATRPLLIPKLTNREFQLVAQEFADRFYATFNIKPEIDSDTITFKTKDLIKTFWASKKQSEQPTDPKLHQQGIYR